MIAEDTMLKYKTCKNFISCNNGTQPIPRHYMYLYNHERWFIDTKLVGTKLIREKSVAQMVEHPARGQKAVSLDPSEILFGLSHCFL